MKYVVVEDWDVEDPAGSPIEEVRRVRDDVEERVKDLIATRVESIRRDRRQHAMRMARLVRPGSRVRRQADGRGDPRDRRRDPRHLRRRTGPVVRDDARQPASARGPKGALERIGGRHLVAGAALGAFA